MTYKRFSDTAGGHVDMTPPKTPSLSEFVGKPLLILSAVKKTSRASGNLFWLLSFKIRGVEGRHTATTSAYGISKALDTMQPEDFPFAVMTVWNDKALKWVDPDTAPTPAPTPVAEPVTEPAEESQPATLEGLPVKGRH